MSTPQNPVDNRQLSNNDGFARPPLDALGFLVAGIVHNLLGPLTGIMGTAELLQMKYPGNEKDFDRISRLVRKLQSDITLMLDKAKHEAGAEIVILDLRNLIQNELDIFRADPRLKHEIELVLEFPENLSTFFAPYREFSIAFDHLLTNAIESMEGRMEQKLTIRITEQSDTIHLEISDTGCGMNSVTLERAFEPFFTTKTPQTRPTYPAIRATGIGLTHARYLLTSLGCSIALQSQLDAGSTAMISIPFAEVDRKSKEILG